MGIDVDRAALAIISGEYADGTGLSNTIESLRQRATQQRNRAAQMFRAFCAEKGVPIRGQPGGETVSAEWLVEAGSEPAVIAMHGRATDLLVLGRTREGGEVAMDVLEAALIETGRPVLLAPPAAPSQVGRVVAIAWKDTREAARAVAAAQPFVRGAERVAILYVVEDEWQEARSHERLRHALNRHNPNVVVRRIDRRPEHPAQTLLSEAAAEGTDLLVMGGYGHSRLREMVLGGVTRQILHKADLAVLIAH